MKKILFQSLTQLYTKVPSEYTKDFRQQKFNQNNFRILLITTFLTFEQLFYGLFLSEKGGLLQKIYFISATITFVLALISIHFYFHKPERILIFHRLYESGIGI